jgi:UDP-3-O-[3-hydroxymyristoyl] glucosamine N-acyltransferase
MAVLPSINIKTINENYDFLINGVSYIGSPINNTVMYISKKIEDKIYALSTCEECLVFAESNISIPKELTEKNCFVLSNNPQLDYVKFVSKFSEIIRKNNRKRKYSIDKSTGICIGENVAIGENAYIEPGAFIDHDVVIGDRAFIGANSIIRNARIGNDFSCGEKTLIGSESFNFAKNECGEPIKIPSLGTIEIGNNVDIGPGALVSLAATSVTKIDDFVKLDAGVVVGHDSHISYCVEIAANSNLAGYVNVGKNTFVSLGVIVKNRINIGENCYIGIGSVVVKDVPDNDKVFGVPARKLRV